MAYRRRNRLRRRNARPTTKRAFKRTGRGIKGVTSVAYRRPGYGTVGVGAFGTRLGRVGRQRNAARAAVLMQRRRRRTGFGGGGEIGWVKKRGGRYRPMTLKKLMTLNCIRNTHRFQGVNRMNNVSSATINPDGSSTGLACPGFYKLSNSPNSNSVSLFPLMCFDLTTVNNTSAGGNAVAWTCSYDITAGQFRWDSVNGQNAGGGTAITYVNEDLTTSINFASAKWIQTDWFDIRAVAYGCRQQPTYYDFMIVQFDKDYLQPCNYSSQSGASAEDFQAYTSFWTAMTKNISYSAIMPAQRDSMRGMRVLRRFRFTLQPSQTTDSDRNPNLRIVKLFQKHYSFDCYNWGKGISATTAANIDGPSYMLDTAGGSNLRNHPEERKRTFLIVRASNTTERAGADETADNTPSFDIIIRKQLRHQVP